jgi:DNA-binding MarR family transcriptional regulator
MARVRGLSRQRVQTLVDALLSEGLVVRIENPRHKRSKLVTLTPEGESVFSTMRAREAELFAWLSEGFSERELRQTLAVVRTLKERLDSDSLPVHGEETQGTSDS